MCLLFFRAVKSAAPSAVAPKPAGAVALLSATWLLRHCTPKGMCLCVGRGEVNVAKRHLNLNASPRFHDATWWDLTSHMTRAEGSLFLTVR